MVARSFSPVTHLYPCGVQPVWDVTVTFTGRAMDSLLWSRQEVMHSDPAGK